MLLTEAVSPAFSQNDRQGDKSQEFSRALGQVWRIKCMESCDLQNYLLTLAPFYLDKDGLVGAPGERLRLCDTE